MASLKFLLPTRYKINIEDNEKGKIDSAKNMFKNRKVGNIRVIPTNTKIKLNIVLPQRLPETMHLSLCLSLRISWRISSITNCIYLCLYKLHNWSLTALSKLILAIYFRSYL